VQKAVLVVDPRSFRRAAVCQALAARKVSLAEAPSLFQGIAALGRADFSLLLMAEGRPASMRGLCRLARKRHPGIRILVMLNADANPEAVRSGVGVAVQLCSHSLTPAQVVDAVERAQKAPAPLELDPLHTAMVQMDVERALAEEQEHPAQDDDASEPLDFAEADENVLLEGSLEGESGAALLMGLFAQEVTGRLKVEGGAAAGTYGFDGGEPVLWETTDTELFQALVRSKAIPADTVRPAVADGEMTDALVRDGVLTLGVLTRQLQEGLKERLRLLVAQKEGAYRFSEATDFLESGSLTRVNPFGIILDHHRRSMSPDRLHVVGMEMERKFIHPGAALGAAAPRLKSFAKGANVAAHIDGAHTVEQFYAATSLDLLMGALVIITMVDAQLVTLQDKAVGAALGRVALRKVLRPADPSGES
jgi:DNA-binding NarL/FixJ family response regulator